MDVNSPTMLDIAITDLKLSKWATTIRYNTSFKTNRDNILNYCLLTEQWIKVIEKKN